MAVQLLIQRTCLSSTESVSCVESPAPEGSIHSEWKNMLSPGGHYQYLEGELQMGPRGPICYCLPALYTLYPFCLCYAKLSKVFKFEHLSFF
jgi:hypothetical protein